MDSKGVADPVASLQFMVSMLRRTHNLILVEPRREHRHLLH